MLKSNRDSLCLQHNECTGPKGGFGKTRTPGFRAKIPY